MSEKTRREMPESEEIKEILGVVSTEIPALIKGIISSVFSEEAGKSMGRAAAAFYKELKESGMPEDVAIKMTENYISVFTSLGDILKRTGKLSEKEHGSSEIREEIGKKIKEALAEETREE
jgi:hypothetical protein